MTCRAQSRSSLVWLADMQTRARADSRAVAGKPTMVMAMFCSNRIRDVDVILPGLNSMMGCKHTRSWSVWIRCIQFAGCDHKHASKLLHLQASRTQQSVVIHNQLPNFWIPTVTCQKRMSQQQNWTCLEFLMKTQGCSVAFD